MKTITSFAGPMRRPRGQFHVPVSILSVAATLGALVALWAPTYIGVADNLGGGFSASAETLAWALLAVGVFGWAGVFYLAWQDTRDPAWRTAHGLPRHPQSSTAAR